MPDRYRGWRLAAGVALVFLAVSPWLDGPLRTIAAAWGKGGLGWLWGRAAYYSGLGGLQIGIMAVVALWAAYRRNRSLMTLAWTAAGAAGAAGLAAQLIKHLAGRPRPHMGMGTWDFQGLISDSDFHSMPSGHAATSFALAVVLAARFPRYGWLFYSLAGVLSLGRLLSDSHYLSDICCGALLGVFIGLALMRWVSGRRAAAA